MHKELKWNGKKCYLILKPVTCVKKKNRQNKREKQEPFKIKDSDKKYRVPKLEPMMSCGLMPTHY